MRHGLTQESVRLRSQFAPLRCTCQTELGANHAIQLCAEFGLLDAYCEAMLSVFLLAQATLPSMHARRRGVNASKARAISDSLLFRCPHPGCGYGFVCDKLHQLQPHPVEVDDEKQFMPLLDVLPDPAAALPEDERDEEYDAGMLPPANPFDCPACQQPVCDICLHVAHPLTCEQVHEQRAQEVAALLSTVKGLTQCGLAQQCPFCGVVVERTDGCMCAWAIFSSHWFVFHDCIYALAFVIDRNQATFWRAAAAKRSATRVATNWIATTCRSIPTSAPVRADPSDAVIDEFSSLPPFFKSVYDNY